VNIFFDFITCDMITFVNLVEYHIISKLNVYFFGHGKFLHILFEKLFYMEISGDIEFDLGLNTPYTKGQNIPVRNCWHFSTNGNLVDYLFRDEEDFIAGTNRIFVLLPKRSYAKFLRLIRFLH